MHQVGTDKLLMVQKIDDSVGIFPAGVEGPGQLFLLAIEITPGGQEPTALTQEGDLVRVCRIGLNEQSIHDDS